MQSELGRWAVSQGLRLGRKAIDWRVCPIAPRKVLLHLDRNLGWYLRPHRVGHLGAREDIKLLERVVLGSVRARGSLLANDLQGRVCGHEYIERIAMHVLFVHACAQVWAVHLRRSNTQGQSKNCKPCRRGRPRGPRTRRCRVEESGVLRLRTVEGNKTKSKTNPPSPSAARSQ
jgi:hypothetical protein